MVARGIALALQHVWTTLDAIHVPKATMGGIALAAWDRLRFTQDVDLLIGMEDDSQDLILKTLREADIRPIHDPPVVTIGELKLIQLLYEPPEQFLEFRIDLFSATSEFHANALQRRVPTKLPNMDLEVEVVACEDLIILKLLAGRIIDRADAAALLRANRDDLEVDHLLKWCERLQLGSELAEIWDEAFPGETPPSG